MSLSNSPCAACKCLRRKCLQECVFAPYFPPDNPEKFTNVHRVFGASNVSKLLNDLNASQREDAVNSLAYEADYRLQDPVYGCVGLISILQHKLKQVHHDLENAKKELATYIGPAAMLPMLNHHGLVQQQQNFTQSAYPVMNYNNSAAQAQLPTGIPQLMICDPQQQQQYLEAQQLGAMAAAREQEMLRTFGQPQNELVRYNGGFDDTGGFNQIPAAMQPSLALGSSFESSLTYHQIQQQESTNPHQLQAHELILQQQLIQQPQQQQQTLAAPLRAKSEEGGSN